MPPAPSLSLAKCSGFAILLFSLAINDMQEEHRLQFEKHAQNLKKIKSEVQGRIQKKEASEIGSGAEGMHEAILDIVKAMHDLTSKLF